MVEVKVRNSFQLSKYDEDGIVKGSSYERISWRNNFDMKISNRISLTANVGIIDEKRQLVDESGMATGTVYTAMGGDPITPVFRNNLVDVYLVIFTMVMSPTIFDSHMQGSRS